MSSIQYFAHPLMNTLLACSDIGTQAARSGSTGLSLSGNRGCSAAALVRLPRLARALVPGYIPPSWLPQTICWYPVAGHRHVPSVHLRKVPPGSG